MVLLKKNASGIIETLLSYKPSNLMLTAYHCLKDKGKKYKFKNVKTG